MRISRHQALMETAQVWARRSTCCRLNVGAVVAINGRIISQGYNGSEPGEPHCTGNSCPGINSCHLTKHAEVNALERAYAPPHLTGMPWDLYVTHSPCNDCLDEAFRYKVGRIFFGETYRLNNHLARARGKIGIFRVTPAGYVLDYFTGQVLELAT